MPGMRGGFCGVGEGAVAVADGAAFSGAGLHAGSQSVVSRTATVARIGRILTARSATWNRIGRHSSTRGVNLQPILDAPFAIQLHFVTVVPAFFLGAWQLLASRKGSPSHRLIGKIYLMLMSITAMAAFFIPSFTPFSISAGPIRLGLIHLFIPLTVNGIWQTRKALRTGNIAAHKASMRGLYIGGLIIAGLLTFIPGRIMYRMFLAESSLVSGLQSLVSGESQR